MRHTLLALSILASGTALFQPGSLKAQDVYHGSQLDARQHGFEHGYRDGFAFGGNSQTSNRDQDIVNQKLQVADREYQPAFGAREQYRQGYAEGFRSGMEDSRAHNRSRLEELFRAGDPGYNPDRRGDDRFDGIYSQNQWPATHVANDFGYKDGLNAGIRDRKDGLRFQPRQHIAWKVALHGYDGRSLPKGQYMAAYRAAYQLGYQDGFGRPR